MKNQNEEYVRVNRQKIYSSGLDIKSKADFLDDPLIMKITDEFISFERPSIDYKGKTNKLSKKGWTRCTTVGIEIKEGYYLFDQEESNEDFLIAYLKQ